MKKITVTLGVLCNYRRSVKSWIELNILREELNEPDSREELRD